MNQNRRQRDNDVPNRSSNMEPAEGSRETVRNSSNDLGSSSDRAMFSDRMDESGQMGSRERGSSMQDEKGMGSGGERNRSNAGGITNRPLSEEQSEQNELPERGRSKSDSER
jgi:hypothetical protein